MRQGKTKELALLALLTALTIAMGLFVQIPTPTGVTSLLDLGIFFTAFYLGKREGAIVGALSALLFDLIAGYPQWAFISLIAHGAQGFFAGFSRKKPGLGLALATVAMVLIYFLGSAVTHGVGKALAEILSNSLQNLVGMLGAYCLYINISKVVK